MSRSYQDFEPDCQYKQGETQDIVEFQLKDFRKDQMKVHIGSNGVLTVSGERPLEGSKWIRFRKEFETPKDCKASDIRARFSSGFLYITIPKKTISSEVLNQDPPTSVQQSSVPPPVQDKGKLKQETSMSTAAPTEKSESPKARPKRVFSSPKMDRKTIMKIGESLMIAAVLFIVLFYVFKFYDPMTMNV